MVGQEEAFFNGAMPSSDGVRLASPRLDFRWRYAEQELAIQQEETPFYGDEDGMESPFFSEPTEFEDTDVVYTDELDSSPRPSEIVEEPITPPQPPHPFPQQREGMPPQIMLLQIAQMYRDEWRLSRMHSTADKSYVYMLPRGCKLSLKEAIKHRKALIITMDREGKISFQDLRKTPSPKKGGWWKNIFGWH